MNSKKFIPIAASIVVLIALIVGGILFYRSSDTNKKMDAFENTVNTLKDLRLQYSTGSYNAVYESLVDECNLCLTNKDTKNISSLTERIKELKLSIISESKQISDFKAQLSTYQNAISLYVISGVNKTEYNRLLSELETAITKSDVKSCTTLSKQMNALLSKLKTANEQEAANADKKYKEELEKIQKQLKESQNSKKNSGDTNIYIAPKTEKKVITKTAPPKVVYVVPDNCDFICPDSNTRYLTDSDLCYLTSSQLRIARNEIFARYGRRFTSKDLQAYFDSKYWYNGCIAAKDFDDDCLTKIEQANIALIQKYEAKYK